MKFSSPKLLLLCSIVVCLLAFHSEDAAAELVVVVSSRSAVSGLTSSQVARIFLGKTGVYPNGNFAAPLDRAEGSRIREEFYLKVTGKNVSQLRAYWAKIIFSGDGQPPRILQNSEDVKRELERNPDAIGYIDGSEVDDRVRVVLTP